VSQNVDSADQPVTKITVKKLVGNGFELCSPPSIMKNMLLPWLQVNEKQSKNASLVNRPIVAELMLHCTLCYLGGGSYHDIWGSAGLSTAAFYRNFRHGLDAINSCPALLI
jgi:hypothetical protein